MELPKIIQDDQTVKSQLYEFIQQRYDKTSRQNRFYFQLGEQAIIKDMQNNEELIKMVSIILNTFALQQIENGYCYYFLKWTIGNNQSNIQTKIQALQKQLELIRAKESQYNKINHLIVMREVLLSKLQNKNEINSEISSFIEDIRFITEQVIKSIRFWQLTLRQNKMGDEHMVYVYKDKNYMTKMINDNQHILNAFNAKNHIFLNVPNPLFLTVDKLPKDMHIQQINQVLEIFSEEKAYELRMMIESPFYRSVKNVQLQEQLKLLKSRVEDDKIDKIKTIYNSNKTQNSQWIKSSNIFSNNNQHRMEAITLKNQKSIKNLQNLIKIKQIEMLKQIKKKKIYKAEGKMQNGDDKTKSNNPVSYRSKIQNLRTQIQKNMKLNEQRQKKKERLPKVEAQIKSSKPKIKIILQRQTPVENVVKNIVQSILLEPNQKKMTRSRSTFYKISNQIQLKDKLQKPEHTRIPMISSGYSSNSLLSTSRRKTFSTGGNLRLKYSSVSKSNKQLKQKSQHLSRQQQLKEVKDSLAMLQNRIREQSIKNIYSNKHATKKIINSAANSIGQKQQKQIIDKNDDETDKTKDFGTSIKDKQKHIDQLRNKLKELKELRSKSNTNIQQQLNNSKMENQENIKLLKVKQLKQKLQLQNMKIKQQMKLEQIKYLTLKQKQYKLKEQEMHKKYNYQLQKIKEELAIKNQEYEKKIIQEKKKNKDNEEKAKQIAAKSEAIRQQLNERQIKQSLLVQILREEQIKKNQQIKQQQERERTFALIEAMKRQQEKYKQELQRRAVETYESQKLKLKIMFLQMQKKNQELEEQNRIKHQQLKQIEDQKIREEEEMKKLQSQIVQKDQNLKLFNHLQNNQIKNQIKNKKQTNQQEQLQQLKTRLKIELIQQIRRQRHEQEQQQKIYEQQRRKHIQQLQQELRITLKMEDQQLKKIQEQYELKNQQMIRQYQQQMKLKQIDKEKREEQAKLKLKRLQYQEVYQHMKLINIETGLEGGSISDNTKHEHQHKNIIQPIHIQIQNKHQEVQMPKIQIKESEQMQMIEEKNTKIQINQQDANKEQIKLNQIPLEMQSPSKYPSAESPIKTNEQTVKKQQEIAKVTQNVKQSSLQIKQKYNNILNMITNPIKQIFIPIQDIDTYLNKYYSQLPQEVKDMLPYSKKQLQAIFRDRKIDIFDGYNFGWYKHKQRKFLLFGSFECIPLIASKYGEIQIEQIYIFSKNNGYQKQFLSKQIKLYEKIGYIFQKKTNQQNQYSIKLIVKIPKQITKKQIDLKDQILIKTTLVFEQHNQNEQSVIKSNCIFYQLSQGLNQLLSQQQKIQLAGKDEFDCKYINKKINDKSFNNAIITTQKISHSVSQMTIHLPLKYIQTSDQAFISMQAIQYVITTTQQKLYLIRLQQHNLAIIIHKLKESDIPKEFNIENYIETKFKKMEKQTDLNIFLPVWQNNFTQKHKGNSPKSFTYRQNTKANFIYGSVISSRVHKGQFIFIEPPFAFILFEMNTSQVLKRILFGHIILSQEVLTIKRSVS